MNPLKKLLINIEEFLIEEKETAEQYPNLVVNLVMIAKNLKEKL